MPSAFLHPFSAPAKEKFITVVRGEGALLSITSEVRPQPRSMLLRSRAGPRTGAAPRVRAGAPMLYVQSARADHGPHVLPYLAFSIGLGPLWTVP